MSKYSDCLKKLNISDREVGNLEAIANNLQASHNLAPSTAYEAAIQTELSSLQLGRTALIESAMRGETTRQGFAQVAPVEKVTPTAPVTREKQPKKKVTAPKPVRKPTKKKAELIKAKIVAARDQVAKAKTEAESEAVYAKAVEDKVFTDEDLAQLREIMVEMPVEDPTSTFVVKNREAAKRAIAMAKLDDSSIRKNKDGTYTVELKTIDPAMQAQDFDAPAAQVIEQTSKVFDIGQQVSDRRIELMDTNKVVKGKNPNPKANITEVVKLGAMLSGKPIDYKKNLAKQVRDNLMEGLAYLQDKGYELETRKGDKLGLPGDLVVFGNNLTLNNLKQVSKEIEEISRQLRILENTKPTDELFDPANADLLAEYYIAKRKATRKLAAALDKYGIAERDAAFSPEDIIDTAGVVEGHEPNTFANLTPEYTGKATKRQTSRGGPDNVVQAYDQSISQDEVQYTVGLLQHLGIKTNVNFVSEDNISFMISGLEEQITSDPKNAETYKTKIAELEQVIIDKPKGRIIYFDNLPNVKDRVPVIFISKLNQKQKRVRIFTHELGHLVQRVMLDQAPVETQNKLREVSGEMSETAFQEWFANQLLVWANKRSVPKGMIEKFFKGFVAQLKRLFNYLTKTANLNETYAEFMDAMVSAEGQRTGGKPSRMRTKMGRVFENEILDIPSAGPFLMRSGMQQYADFTPMTPALSNLLRGAKIRAKKAFDKTAATKTGQITGDGVKQVGETFLALHNAVIRSADAKLRAMKVPVTDWIANNWHIRSGQGRAEGHRTIPTEILQRGARFHSEIKRISQKVMPRKYGKVVDTIFGLEAGRLDKSSVIYNEIGDILVSEKLPDVTKLSKQYNKETVDAIINGYNETRLYLDDLYVYLTGDFARQRSDSKLTNKAHLGLAIKHRKNYFPHALDVTVITTEKTEFISILKSEGIGNNIKGKTQDQALEEFYQSLVMSDGTVMELEGDNTGDILGPSFSGLSARVFEPALVAKLQKFYINDTMSVLTTYTHSAMKRGIIQQRFNPNNEMRIDKRTGISKFDPLFELNERLDKAEEDYSKGLDTGLSPEQIAQTRKIIDAYLGRLGANMNPKLRNMSALMVTYQNMRLLSFVVLSSVVDAGLIDARSGMLFTSLREAFKLISSKQSRQELYEAAEMIGAIRDDITEHVVSDQQSMTYMSHKMKGHNEAFFRLVRMHQWTNLSRVMALSAGKTFMIRHANRPKSKQSQKYLKELGVTAQEVLEWGGDTVNMSDNISSALHQFIDESAIRPGAAIRPDWASDPHWAVFFHLKQFMWGYHEQILRRVWEQTKTNEGLYKAVPIMLLAAATLPLAAAGYELRRWLGGAPAYTDKEGGDYFWELIQRSGGLGVMQLYVDADEAEEHGQFAPMAAMGPSVSWLNSFIVKDLDVALARSLPFVAQMPALRNWITN